MLTGKVHQDQEGDPVAGLSAPETAPQFAEYLAAYNPSVTGCVEEQPFTKQFPYSCVRLRRKNRAAGRL